ncbi:hypothetical protein N7495_000815 [Penicillium taxi]|uniref:uncharacterized protein n=1 Tax=Penicillium taxi TaxID=168475 RepID=UPI0025457C08|nr:uncharacterized protein N7495_000815 [Penicillium taxi]KAJ5908133.1 hypothetical protein N7495_000815 [Penicillium taxi]
MPSEPDEEAIASFVNMLSTTRDKAISFLKTSWSNTERENQELQQAMEMSLNEGMGYQETGVVTAATAGASSEPHFGKATRENYDDSDWAMTLFNETAQEIVVNLEPEDRKKIGDEPVFLRPTTGGLHLGGLITILHGIPLAREALLLRNKLLYDYGGDSQWWNGHEINLPKIVSLHEGNDNTDWEDVIHEAQRLMAFLDSTQRAFGSSDALVHIKQETDSFYSSDSEEAVSRFLEAWHSAAERADPKGSFSTVFKSLAFKKSPFDDENYEPEAKEVFILEPPVEQEHGQTLYDVLDKSIWSDLPNCPDLDDVWLEHVSDVLVMKLDAPQNAKSVDVKIPAVFYPDRYLSSHRELSRDLRTKRLQAQEHLMRIQSEIERWTKLPKPYDESRPDQTRAELLEGWANLVPVVLNEAISRHTDLLRHMPDMMSIEAAQEKAERIPRLLRAKRAKLELKLKGILENKKQEAIEALRSYSKFLTEPSDSSDSPVFKYMLRGVCTEPHVTYVSKPSDTSDSDGVMETDDDQTPSHQWWRISFSTDDGKTQQAEKRQANNNASQQNGDVMGYTARKVREIEVLRAAREEGRSVLLVYASEAAIKAPVKPLPPQLLGFVTRDNEAFAAECEDSRMEIEQIQDNDTHEQPSNDQVSFFDTEWCKSEQTQNNDTHEQPSKDQVNVFDYEIYKSDNEDESNQEMTEKDGPSLLAGTVMQADPMRKALSDNVENGQDRKGF